MLKENAMYVLCGPRKSFCQSTEESVGMSNEEERDV